MNNQPSSIDSTQIKFLTLNCWGLKYVSAHRQERIHAIGDFLASSSSTNSSIGSTNSIEPFSDAPVTKSQISSLNTSTTAAHRKKSNTLSSNESSFEPKSKSFDIVALQELWVYHDFLVIRNRAKEGGFQYSKFFHSAALGSGLAILSRFPIISSHFHPYSLNGHPLHFIQGDFFVGKSVGSCLIDVPTAGQIEVFTTHLYAPHDVPAPEWKRAHRTAQAWELAKLVRASAERGRAVFVCGDLNSVPASLPIAILQSYGQLRDSWVVSHPGGSSPTSETQSSYRNAIQDEGITCDSLINTFTSSKDAANRGAKGFGKRLDYILYRPASRRLTHRDQSSRYQAEFVDDQRITCDQCEVTLVDPIPVFGYSYSDHFAVEASFTIHPKQFSEPEVTESRPSPPNVEVLTVPQLTAAQLNQCMSALMIKRRASERSSKIQLSLFAICVILVPGVSVAASFQPLKYLNWIFTLLSFFIGGFGMTMLYSGFLAGSWERSAIQETYDQIEFELQSLLKNHNHQEI